LPFEEVAELVDFAGADGDHEFVVGGESTAAGRIQPWAGTVEHVIVIGGRRSRRDNGHGWMWVETGRAGKGLRGFFLVYSRAARNKLTGMNRRTFLLRSAGLAAAGLWSRSLVRAQPPGPSSGSTEAKPAAAPNPVDHRVRIFASPYRGFYRPRRNDRLAGFALGPDRHRYPVSRYGGGVFRRSASRGDRKLDVGAQYASPR